MSGESIESKVDELIGMVREINVHLKYGQDRMENICEKLGSVEARTDFLESRDQQVKGELTMLRWLGVAAVVLATVAVPIIMAIKGGG